MKHVFPSDVIDTQWIFNRVVEHYRAHPKQSRGSLMCAYRSSDGNKCFAGALIDDDLYAPEMETVTVTDLPHKFKMPDWFVSNLIFIAKLQIIHDNRLEWKDMPAALGKFAREHHLTMP